jgi:hypothetical protein
MTEPYIEGTDLSITINADILKSLAHMDIAEEEITRVEKQHLRKARKAFPLLFPGELLHLAEVVYRHHVREIIWRVIRGHDTRLATTAEIMNALSQVSFTTPIRSTPAALYERLFKDVFGKVPDGQPAHEAYVGACSELYLAMEKKLTKPERTL